MIYYLKDGNNKQNCKIVSKLITGSDGCNHIIWYDEDFIKNFYFEKIYVDGTFKVRPKMFWTRKSQFLTIMTKYNGRVRSILK